MPRDGLLCALALALGCQGQPAATDTLVTASSSTGTATTSIASTSTTTPTTGTSGQVTEDMPEDAWSVSLELGVDRGALFSVWGPAPDEVYVVGGQGLGAESTGAMLRWDGAAWTDVDLPPGTGRLHWIAGVGDDLWTVGEHGTALRRSGDAWTVTDTGIVTSLWGIWGADPATIWAVGGDGFTGPPLLLRWDGAAWQPDTTPTIPEDCHALFKIWGTGAGDVTAVGDFGVALQRTGDAWALTDTASIADLISVHGVGESRVAVGGRANARIGRWDGQAWTGETLDRPGLSGVWVAADGSATAVGNNGQILHSAAGDPLWLEEASPTHLVLHAVFGFAGGPRFAVGGNVTGQPPYIGIALRHPG